MGLAWRGTIAAGLTALFVIAVPAKAADGADARPEFSVWLDGVRSEAIARGIGRATVDQALSGIRPIDRVVELDRHQPEFTMSFATYLSHVVNKRRVLDGRRQIKRHQKGLAAASARFGVPVPVIVAMWGIESDYGRLTGGFPVVPALATLAYDGRRSQYFRQELLNALAIIDRGVPPARMRGSWAGAMGQCQFMPSTYLRFAKATGGDAVADIWTRHDDVFASTANYLSQLGWNPRQHWGRAVLLAERAVPAEDFGIDVRKSLKEWDRLGVRLAGGKRLPARDDIQASLIRAGTGKPNDSAFGTPYLVYDNFRVLMQWNRSVFFALAAGTLADRLGSH